MHGESEQQTFDICETESLFPVLDETPICSHKTSENETPICSPVCAPNKLPYMISYVLDETPICSNVSK